MKEPTAAETAFQAEVAALISRSSQRMGTGMDWQSDQLKRLKSDLELLDWWINVLEEGGVVQRKFANGETVDLSESALEACRQIRTDMLVFVDRVSGLQ